MEIEEKKDICLYIHTRKDDGVIFYVGIGNEKRPYDKNKRSKFWKNMVKKHNGFDVNIIKTDMSWKQACNLEIKMISFYGRIKPNPKNLYYGCLVNMTDGGDGTKGFTHSEETKEKMREFNRRENHPMFGKTHSEETKEKIRKATIAKNNPFFGKTHNKETKEKMKKPKSDETKKKMSIIRKERKIPSGNRVKIIIDNIEYDNSYTASELLGIPSSTIRDRIRNKNFNNYNYA